MSFNRQTRGPAGSGGATRAFVSRSAATAEDSDITALRPIRSVLNSHDYWQLQEHRRRCDDLGGALFGRLAQLIRAKMADAHVPGTADLPPNAVTGGSRVCFAIRGQRTQTRTLYHWGYPDRERNRLPVGTFLGVTLIGMTEGQRAVLLDADGVAGEVTVLSVHHRPEDGLARHD
mgnify:CR=1 FL=1